MRPTYLYILSLLAIIYGTKGEEGGGSQGVGVERSFLPDASQQQHMNADLSFIKTPRSIRTPFRNTEIMTARGFGKRSREDQEYDSISEKRSTSDQQTSDDYRDENFSNLIKQRQQLLFPFSNQFPKAPQPYDEPVVIPPVRSHRLQIRDGTLKFRLNDGNLRIGRGFGKRNYGVDPFVENLKTIQFFRRLASQNQQMSPMAYDSAK